ncbi:tetratricopeptide repeat protein [Nocardia brasiliensis]|uniref:Tetratricopeptide repeat protein n=1 Tax=Nocardia brasiliensis TaxID=37326 RepID=A0A6G9Y125_NOCBR|nr:tetratricopeptide repeat protein [Nocardia brasiliensis]QIS06902.1 tetratricopeptide repeat protein [Nocardia brasiliensis]
MDTGTSDDGRALLAAGAEAYSRGDTAEALRIFEDAARTTTGDVRIGAIVNAASMADELGEHATALRLYREALAAMPQDAPRLRPNALVNMSQALQHLGELDAAQEALEQARALLAASTDPEQGVLRVACLLSLTAVALHRQQWAYAAELATESLDAARRFAPKLAGHPLMNLAATYFETGRRELAVDLTRQALAAFDAAGDRNAVAETQQNLATMLVRLARLDEAEAPLQTSQRYFEQAGLGHRAGIGLKTLAFLAEGRGELTRAQELYERGLAYFVESGAVLDAADLRMRLATVAFKNGDAAQCEALLAQAFTAYAERGLGLHCAQLDYWHATLLEGAVDAAESPSAQLLAQAVEIAVPAALAIDAVRYTLPNGTQRDQWNRQIADPAMRLAFRFAYLSGNGLLLADLIETQCAGTTLNLDRAERPATAQLPLELFEPPAEPTADPGVSALQLGAALAEVAAAAGLPVSSPPRLALAAEGRIALAPYIAAAEQRYGRVIRDSKVLTV